MSVPEDRDREDFDRIDRLFEQALDLPPAERAVFLHGIEEPVRRRVERLLAAADDEGADLRSGGAWAGPLGESLRRELEDGEPAEPTAAPGTQVGRYQLLRELGRGGMAVVYLAERTEGDFQQQVAVKLLKRGIDSEEILRRFEQERQILATAKHPGLARLLDGGTTADGRPFLVMEHVEGRPIDEHCDAHRLSVPKCVRLFLQVARAVEAAHRNLVVHRDIKPSNVLVTPGGHAKLLDFGIAKLLDVEAPLELTRPLARLLTPAYASPEQLAGEPVTVASDIYQLGLLLSRLLAGEMRLPRDLDLIVKTALRPEPERRYGSVSALAADLERFLEGRPIAARPDTAAYRTSKFVQRHRAAVATASIAAILLMTTAVSYGLRLARERDRAELAARRATQTTELLRGLFRVAAPSRSSGEQITARELLELGATRLTSRPDLSPELRADLLTEIGGVYRELAFYEEAQAQLEEAVVLRRRSPGPDRLDLAASLQGLAEVKLELSKLDAAQRLFAEALAIREAAWGAEHPDVALSLVGLGRIHAAQARFGEAAKLQARALSTLEQTLGRDHEEVGRAARHFAHSLRGQDRTDEARRHLERALEVLTARLGADHVFVGTARVELAEILAGQGERTAARAEFERALPVLERVYGRLHPALAHAYTALADILTAPGPDAKDAASAILYYQRGLDIRERTLGADHPQVADSLLGLGRAYPMAGRDAEARRAIERALKILTLHFGAEHIDLAVPLAQLAKLHQRAGRHREALQVYARVVALREKTLGPRHSSLTLPLYEQAQIYRSLGQPKTAEALLRRILEAQRNAPGAEHGLAFIRVELGRCLIDLSRFAEAEAELLPVARGEEPHSRRRAQEALEELYRRREPHAGPE
jgi:serine/threonine-protein kinase